MPILKNTLNETILFFNASSGVINIQGNNSVSNVAYTNSNGVSQNVASASIRKIIASSNNSTAQWTVYRGANVAWVASGNFMWDFSAHNMVLNQDNTAPLTANIVGGSGTIAISISKDSV